MPRRHAERVKEKPAAQLAPTASALQAAPAAPSAAQFSVDPASSKVTFLMDSPLEKIDGDASGGLSGDLFVDLTDLGKIHGAGQGRSAKAGALSAKARRR